MANKSHIPAGFVCVLIGKNAKIPNGWRAMSKEESEAYIKGRMDQIAIEEGIYGK